MKYFLKHTFILSLILFSAYNSFSQNLFVNGDFQEENLDNYTPNVAAFCNPDGIPDCPSASIDNGYYNPASLGGYDCTSAFPRVDGWDPVVNHSGFAIPFYECAGIDGGSGCAAGVVVNRCNRHGVINTLPGAETVSLDENNFVGLRTYYNNPNTTDNQAHDMRAYLTGRFTSPLVAGQSYNLSFYMILASASNFTTKGIQWKFSQLPLQVPHTADGSGDPETQAQWSLSTALNNDGGNNNPSGGIDDLRVTDQVNWTHVTACYTAVGGEEYFTIGNFMLDADVDPQVNPSPEMPPLIPSSVPAVPQAYYYFDDFSLTPLVINTASTDANCGASDGTITISANGAFITGDSYDITYTQDGTIVGPNSIIANANGDLVITGLPVGVYTDITVEGSCNIIDAGPIQISELNNCNGICDGDDIVESTSGFYTGAGFEQIYVLVNLATGNIVASNSTGTFTQSDYGVGNLGGYQVYAVNTNDAGVIADMNGTGSWATAQANAALLCADISTAIPITIEHCCDLLVTDVTVTNETCDGYEDGEIAITITGSSQYDISVNGSTTPAFDDVSAGTYTLSNLSDTTYAINISDIISGAAGTACDTIFDVVINPGYIIPLNAGVDTTICEGETIVLTADNPDNASLSWNNGVTDGNAFAPPLGTTTYIVSATNLGCVASDTLDVIVDLAPEINALTSNTPICEGEDAIFTITGTENATVTYNIDAGATQTIVLDAAGTGTVTEASVAVNTSINLLDITAAGGSGSVTITGNGLSAVGGNYTDNSLGSILPVGSAVGNTNSAIIDSSHPTLTLTLEHTVPVGTDITIAIARNNDVGDCDITDGTNTINFAAGPNDISQYITFTTGQSTNTLTFSRNSGGTWIDGVEYSFTTSSTTTGCSVNLSNTETVIVTPLPVFTVVGTNPTICGANDGFITISGLNINTDYQVSYNDGSVQGPTAMTADASGDIVISNLSAGSYTDFTINLTACISIDNTVIDLTDPNAPTVNAGVDQAVCDGDAVTLTADNPDGASISWNNSVTDGIAFTPTATATYTVTADLAGCISTDVTEVVVNALPIVNAGVDQAVCDGDAVSLTADNPDGASISWDNGITDGLAFTPSVGTTTYTVTATLLACVSTDVVDVLVNTNPTPSITGNDFCIGNSTILDAGSAYQSYSWNPTGLNTQTISVTGGGTYAVTVSDANGCFGSDDILITMNSLPTVDAGVDQDICIGETATLTATSTATNFDWNNGLGIGNPQQVNPLVNTTYTVTVTDANNCSNSDNVVVNVHSLPVANLDPVDVSCFGLSDGSINLTVSGGQAPYSFNWDNGEITNNIGNLSAAMYSVTVEDVYNCQDTESAQITEPAGMNLNINGVGALCYGDENLSIDLNVNGGTGSYSYLWNTGDVSEDLQDIAAGQYTVTVTDENSCSQTISIDLQEPTQLIVALPEDFSYCNHSTTIESSVTGGASPYQYQWNNGSTEPFVDYSLDADQSFSVTVTDNNNCVAQDEVNITIPSIELHTTIDYDTVCPGDPVEISANIVGGTAPYMLFTNDVFTTFPNTVHPSGNEAYHIKVVDNCGLIDTQTVFVSTYNVPEPTIFANIRYGCEPLHVDFRTIDNTEGYTYKWNFGLGEGVEITNNSQISYLYNEDGQFDVSLEVSTKGGCKSTNLERNYIQVFPLPEALFYAESRNTNILKPEIYFDNNSEDAVSYLWNFGDGNTSDQENPLHNFYNVGLYNVKLIATNNKGCVDTTEQAVRVEDVYTIWVPTAFSPDGDGRNDVMAIKGHGLMDEGYLFTVYDRWGEPIFESTSIDLSWDGKAKGNDYVQSGVYTWVLHCKDFNGIHREKAGIVTVVR